MYEHLNKISATQQADVLILALRRLDDEAKNAIASIIMQESRRWRRISLALNDALQEQEAEQNALDAWIDTEEARHADAYSLSKEGDTAYWTQ